MTSLSESEVSWSLVCCGLEYSSKLILYVHQIFRILENANSEDYPPDEVRQILNGDEIKEKLTKVTDNEAFVPHLFN